MNERVRLTEEMLLAGWITSNKRQPPPVLPARPANQSLALPVERRKNYDRDMLFLEFTEQGLKPKEIAARCGVSIGMVTGALDRMAKGTVDSVSAVDNSARNETILNLYIDGVLPNKIAERLNLSRPVVNGVIERYRRKPRNRRKASLASCQTASVGPENSDELSATS